ncbi:MAG: hypothetical protein ACRDKL_10855 [Solirubrobacteraceae bacterium]
MTAAADDLTGAGGAQPATAPVRPRRPASLRDAPEEASGDQAGAPSDPTFPGASDSALPEEQISERPSLPRRCVALTQQRPEFGLGVAFLGGLVLATILKRLGRR